MEIIKYLTLSKLVHVAHTMKVNINGRVIYLNLQTKKCYQSQFGCDELISLCVSPGGVDPI